MRKFSNKSKKEKKNAIRRKTKDNRRNNKRRTYRKKVKGGGYPDISSSSSYNYQRLKDSVKDYMGFERPLENKAIAQIKNILYDIIKLYITFINNPSEEKTKGELVTKLDEMTNTGKHSCSVSTVMEGKEAYYREYYECEKQKYIAYATASYLASEIKNTYNDLEYKMDKIITKLDNIKKAKMDTMNKIFPQTNIQEKEDEDSLQVKVYRALKLGFKNRLKEITVKNVKNMIRRKIFEYEMKQMNAKIDNRTKNENYNNQYSNDDRRYDDDELKYSRRLNQLRENMEEKNENDKTEKHEYYGHDEIPLPTDPSE